MHIAGDFHEVAAGIDEKGLVPSLVKMACPLVLLVEVACIGDIEVTHQFLEVCMGCFHDEVKMVVHEDKGDESDLVDLDGPGKEVEEFSSVGISCEDSLPPVTSTGHVVIGVLILDA